MGGWKHPVSTFVTPAIPDGPVQVAHGACAEKADHSVSTEGRSTFRTRATFPGQGEATCRLGAQLAALCYVTTHFNVENEGRNVS